MDVEQIENLNNKLLEKSGIKDYNHRIKKQFRNTLKSKIVSPTVDKQQTDFRNSRQSVDNSQEIDSSTREGTAILNENVSDFTVSSDLTKTSKSYSNDFLQQDACIKDMVYFEKHKNFTELCHPQDYDNDSKQCYCCQENFNKVFNGRKNCKFCGNSVCNNCSKRTKKNPKFEQNLYQQNNSSKIRGSSSDKSLSSQIKTKSVLTRKESSDNVIMQNDANKEFVRICEACHFDYMFFELQSKYFNKKKQRDKYQAKEEIVLQRANQKLTKQQNIKESNIQRYKSIQMENEHQNVVLKQKLEKIENQTEVIRQENEDLHAQNIKIEQDKEILDRQISQSKREYNELQLQLEEHDQEQDNLELQINRLKQELNNADKYLTNIKHGQLSQSNDFQQQNSNIYQQNNNNTNGGSNNNIVNVENSNNENEFQRPHNNNKNQKKISAQQRMLQNQNKNNTKQQSMLYSKISESGIESKIGGCDSYYQENKNSQISQSIINKRKDKKQEGEEPCACLIF